MLLEEKYRICVDELRSFTKGIGYSDVVIGLSGGIDSAVTAAMSVQAFGADHVHGVLMPGPFSTGHSVTDAQDLAERLGIETKTVSIKQPYEAFAQVYEDAYGTPLAGLASENTQARCRMIVLMALSNANNWMVVNTGNKSEAMMGYSTLYGDTAGAYAPLGGLYKRDVFALANWLNARASEEGRVQPIPQHIIEKPPSAELSLGQEDEKSLGYSYELLDKMLIAMVEQGKSEEQLVCAGFRKEDIQSIGRSVKAAAFKRALEPPFPAAAFYDE